MRHTWLGRMMAILGGVSRRAGGLISLLDLVRRCWRPYTSQAFAPSPMPHPRIGKIGQKKSCRSRAQIATSIALTST